MKQILQMMCTMIISTLLMVSPAIASESAPVDSGKVVAQLVSGYGQARAGESIDIAVRTVIDTGWHTYWRNTGDSGESVQIEWHIPEGAKASEIIWPLPSTIATGPIINYGFDGIPYFPITLTLPVGAQDGEIIKIGASVFYLVCKDVCIPEQAELSMDIIIGEPVENARWSAAIKRALADAPKPNARVQGAIKKTGGALVISFTNLPKGDYKDAFFFPYIQGVVAPGDPQVVSLWSRGVSLAMGSDFAWDSALPNELLGVLKFKQDGKDTDIKDTGIIVKTKVGGTLSLGALKTGASKVGNSGTKIGFWGAVIGAFLGGIILNLMPCVFPIISMKALGLAKLAHGERAQMRREGWLYSVGVLVCFIVLALILVALKSAGMSVGWGFQLQSPIVVGFLALLLFAIGLNLLGVFDIGSGLQNVGGGLADKGGNSGAFFTGVLAVIVATPCSAPFMAGAVGYGMAQSAGVMLAVFIALGIGFALPFLALAYMPKVLAKLPKPGPWMVRFREALAFPMFLAAVWLMWVLAVQAGADGVLKLMLAMVSLSFALWCFKNASGLAKGLGALALIVALILPATAKTVIIAPSTTAPSSAVMAEVAQSETAPQKQPWSPELVKTLRAEGKTVFVDFTAAWCVSCKFNERLVLNKPATRELFEQTNTVFLVADWTNRNDEIAQELAKYGRSGVPLYLVFAPTDAGTNAGTGEGMAKVLPQLLTRSILRKAVEQKP